MNSTIKQYLTVICLLTLILTVFAACKGKTGDDTSGSTADPFSVTEYPAASTTLSPIFSASETESTTTTTNIFDDFATTTTRPSTTRSSVTQSSAFTFPSTTAATTVPGITDPSVKPTLPSTVDPNLTNTTNGGSKIDVEKLLTAFGYAYDPEEDCFYTELDAWQRKGGFAPHYDLGAFLINMHYLTFTVDFDWGGESWRLQFWKGNYSPVIDGVEIGVYTKPLGSDTTLYDTADDQHLLNMGLTLYSKNPKTEANRMFTRPATDHWWQTGFKLVDPSTGNLPGKMVMVATIRFRDSEMADAFTTALEEVRGNYAPSRAFKQVKSVNLLADECYVRESNTVTMCWRAVGWLNYDFPSESAQNRNGN